MTLKSNFCPSDESNGAVIQQLSRDRLPRFTPCPQEHVFDEQFVFTNRIEVCKWNFISRMQSPGCTFERENAIHALVPWFFGSKGLSKTHIRKLVGRIFVVSYLLCAFPMFAISHLSFHSVDYFPTLVWRKTIYTYTTISKILLISVSKAGDAWHSVSDNRFISLNYNVFNSYNMHYNVLICYMYLFV